MLLIIIHHFPVLPQLFQAFRQLRMSHECGHGVKQYRKNIHAKGALALV